MNRIRPATLVWILLFTCLTLILGCASQQSLGTLALEPKYSEDQILERLQRDWDAYHIYYIGRFQDSPSAVVFDPKEDDRTLQQPEWSQPADSEILRNVLAYVRNAQVHPRLHQILGPDGRFYGYLYAAWDNNVVVKRVDESTLAVYIQSVPIFF